MLAVRYVLPAMLVLIGIVLAIFVDWPRGAEAFSLFAGAGLSILLLNALFRMGVTGDTARDDEAAAREHFETTGEWPDEEEEAERQGGRKWNLPQGVATPESEAAAARAAEQRAVEKSARPHSS